MSAIPFPRSFLIPAAHPRPVNSLTSLVFRIMLDMIVITLLLTALALIFGYLSTSKNQIAMPIVDMMRGSTQIYYLDVDRGTQYHLNMTVDNLTSGLFWSPDGTRFAFEAISKNDNEIYVMNVSGGSPKQLTHDHLTLSSVFAWTPDSRQIAYFSRHNHQISLIAVQGGTTFSITNKAINDVRFLAWSPGGSQLAFLSVDYTGQAALYVINKDGGNIRELANDIPPTSKVTLMWSPDGHQIAFDSIIGGSGNIYSINLNDGILRRLTNSVNGDGGPAWSPDSHQIAYWSAENDGLNFNIMDADGIHLKQLTSVVNASCAALTWSRDGKYIAAGTLDVTSNNSSVYVMKADGSDVYHLLDTDSRNPVFPLWRP